MARTLWQPVNKPWLLVAVGVLAMYVPTVVGLLRTVWSSDEQGHGPIVLAIAIWLMWRVRAQVNDVAVSAPAPLFAWPLILVSVLAYAIGGAMDVLMLEVGSVIPLLAGLVLLVRGPRQLRAMWFPLLFMVFLVPLPGVVVDALTQPMKLGVSIVAEHLLYWLGYPISRSGVILQIGPYQLLVADACAGLHTLFTLEALGLLYLNLVRHSSTLRNVTLAILIVPISFTANVIRVIILTLITYHFGDAAGQGFLHGFAGMVLFMAALLLIISMDSLIRVSLVRESSSQPR
ncbi:exosortase B [Roseateles cellulosilyticus]|uniref:Exosortase B n=1 Tax=Pelomonas cellulosilytica TaxID=2906762 RepID=A0ABS8Y3V0_9BURK|nr:exosortase B [Pelomonas sp. P8]